MSDLLDAIRAERRALIEPLLAPVADKLRVLDEMERLAASLNGGGSDVPAVAAPARQPVAAKPKPAQRALPARTRPTAAGVDGLSPNTVRVLQVVRSTTHWMSKSQIAEADPDLPASLQVYLKRLIDRGLIEANGHTTARRYRAVTDEARSQQRETSNEQSAPAARPHGNGSATRVLRARIIDHLSRRALDEQSLADHLAADREDVAFLCGEMLMDDKLRLLPDGRYEVA